MTDSLPTIGYRANSVISKREVARLQLIESIELFVNEKFLPAITLAGAAEEILGKLLSKQGNINAIQESLELIKQISHTIDPQITGLKTGKEYVDHWNLSRNSLKHLVGSEDEPIEINFCDEAYWMIKRALKNAKSLNLPISNEQEFENWIVLNICI